MAIEESVTVPMLPSDNFLGVVGRFQANPAAVFQDMEAMDSPLVQFRLAHKKPYYVASMDTFKEITRHWKLYQKGSPESTRNLLGNGLVFSEEEEWSKQRRIVSPAFHRKSIQGYVEIMRSRTEEMVNRLRKNAADGKTAQMKDVFHQIAIQVVRDTLFGTNNDNEELQEVLDGTLFLLDHVVKFRKNPLMPPLWMPTPNNRKAMRYHREIERIVLNAIEEKRVSTDKSHTMLEMMLWGRDEESESTLSYQDIIDQVKIFFVAGTDTSANTLSWAFYLLSKHPEVLGEVQAEVDAVLGSRPISLEDVPALSKLRNVILETLRLYPATWINSRRPVEDVVLEGFTIPANSSLVFSPYMLLRQEKYWVHPHEFRPSRFANVDTLPSHYIPFLAGPRKCIGDQFAMTEITVGLATFLQNFTWELPKDFKAEVQFGATLGMKNDMPAKFTIR